MCVPVCLKHILDLNGFASLVTGSPPPFFMKKALGKTACLPCFSAAFKHFYLSVWEILFSNEIFIDIRAHNVIVYYYNL